MKFLVTPTRNLSGGLTIPGNKSGTARAVVIGSLAEGTTTIHNPLNNFDSFSIIGMFRALGAEIDCSRRDLWTVKGTGGNLTIPGKVLDAEAIKSLLR